MKTIFEAKEHFAARYLSEEGFIGVGIGRHEDANVLWVYVEAEDFPIARQLKNEPTYEGFRVIVEVTGRIKALSA